MGRESALVVWLLVLVVGALAAVAYATPLDPTYIAGFWDNDDYDNVITLTTSSSGTTDSHAQTDLMPLLVLIAPVPGGEDVLLSRASSSPHAPRGPPAG
jgi:uncharacterized membrane protein